MKKYRVKFLFQDTEQDGALLHNEIVMKSEDEPSFEEIKKYVDEATVNEFFGPYTPVEIFNISEIN